jgi:multiple antibiotic resistance protein
MVLSGFLVTLAAVFFVVDPVGLIPIFLAITRGDDAEKMRRTSARACFTASVLLTAFALGGNVVFHVLGITLGAFRVAGGLLLLVTALDMLRARPAGTRTSPGEEREGESKDDVAIVPLAVPLLAGPGAIATVMVLAARGKGLGPLLGVLAAIGLTLIASHWILRGAPRLQKLLGKSGIAILERVMGLLLTAVAVQFIADGTRALWLGRPDLPIP